MVILEGDAIYEPFIVELNTLIKHYNNELARHRGRKQTEKLEVSSE